MTHDKDLIEPAKTSLKDQPDSFWKERLTDEQYRVLRKQGTEHAFRNTFNDNHEAGIYRCAGCGQVLFRSSEKYDSGSGWPSFYDVAKQGTIELKEDRGLMTTRIEAVCSRCGGHLGHVFDDGPKPTGKRYCMNSASLTFNPDKK